MIAIGLWKHAVRDESGDRSVFSKTNEVIVLEIYQKQIKARSYIQRRNNDGRKFNASSIKKEEQTDE